jgi:hypothetical protein
MMNLFLFLLFSLEQRKRQHFDRQANTNIATYLFLLLGFALIVKGQQEISDTDTRLRYLELLFLEPFPRLAFLDYPIQKSGQKQ